VLAPVEHLDEPFECGCRAKQAGTEKIEQRPQIAHSVFHRRSGQRDASLGFEFFDGASLSRARVLDRLRFV